jgi:hypothetical protein
LVEDVLLEQREERFHRGVISGSTDSAHRADQSGTAQGQHEWDSDPDVSVTYSWKSLFGGVLATTSTFTPADPDLVVIEATGHKAGYADTTVKSKPLSILSPGTLAITLEVDPGTGASGQFAFSNDQDAAAPVEVKLNGVTYASISVPAGTPEDEGTATVPFSDLTRGHDFGMA